MRQLILAFVLVVGCKGGDLFSKEQVGGQAGWGAEPMWWGGSSGAAGDEGDGGSMRAGAGSGGEDETPSIGGKGNGGASSSGGAGETNWGGSSSSGSSSGGSGGESTLTDEQRCRDMFESQDRECLDRCLDQIACGDCLWTRDHRTETTLLYCVATLACADVSGTCLDCPEGCIDRYSACRSSCPVDAQVKDCYANCETESVACFDTCEAP
jgi:hypothetical protein